MKFNILKHEGFLRREQKSAYEDFRIKKNTTLKPPVERQQVNVRASSSMISAKNMTEPAVAWNRDDSTVADPGFSPGGAPTPKIAIIFHIFAENCMKMKEFGPPGGGARPWRPPWIRQYSMLEFFRRHRRNDRFHWVNRGRMRRHLF